jgi:hypothetical protein
MLSFDKNINNPDKPMLRTVKNQASIEEREKKKSITSLRATAWQSNTGRDLKSKRLLRITPRNDAPTIA